MPMGCRVRQWIFRNTTSVAIFCILVCFYNCYLGTRLVYRQLSDDGTQVCSTALDTVDHLQEADII
jgi:hypothetical protein